MTSDSAGPDKPLCSFSCTEDEAAAQQTALQLQWRPLCPDHLAEPTEWLSLQAQGPVTHRVKPGMNKALLISSAGTVLKYKEDFTVPVISVKSVVVNSSL